jgi:hypothetical protein
VVGRTKYSYFSKERLEAPSHLGMQRLVSSFGRPQLWSSPEPITCALFCNAITRLARVVLFAEAARKGGCSQEWPGHITGIPGGGGRGWGLFVGVGGRRSGGRQAGRMR